MSRRPLVIALFAVVSALSVAGTAHAAVGDLPSLTAGPPNGVTADWYDDHSVIGDDHLSWSDQGAPPFFFNDAGQASQSEPKAIGFDPVLNVAGLGGLEVCGYPSGTVGWMRAYQAAPGAVTAGGSCPATEPAIGQFGWFRYVYGRHSATDQFNRWHVMDLDRYALVPLPAGQGGPAGGAPTIWDNHWGSCLNLADIGTLSCPTNRAAAGLDVGVPTGVTKTTGIYYTSPPNAVDEQVIPIPRTLQDSLPDGLYQVVDLVNPYGLLKEAGGDIGSVSCVTVNLTIGRVSGPTFADVNVPVTNADPTDCYLPRTLDPMLSGPGLGYDPMAGADNVPDCPHTDVSHCWVPTGVAPHDGPYTAAHSIATGDASPTDTMLVGNRNAIPEAVSVTGRRALVPRPIAAAGGNTSLGGGSGGGTPPKGKDHGTSAATKRALALARSRTRSALRKVFGKGLSRLHVSCRLRKGGASTCTVSWRKSRARYSGHIYLRNHRVNGHLRWQYRVDVTRKKKGHKTTHVRRGYRTGGRVG